MTPTQNPAPTTGQHILPGLIGSPKTARLLATALLPPHHPALWEVQLVTSELVANAIDHSRSGIPNGELGLSVDPHHPDGVLIEIIDAGPLVTRPTVPNLGGVRWDGVHGRGLVLVDGLATRWGTAGLPHGYRTVWAVISNAA